MTSELNRRSFLLAAGGAYAASATRLRADAPEKTPLKLEPFDYQNVRLLPGMFQRQMEEARERYFGIANNDLLKGFRRDAGLPAPGNDMLGWCRRDCRATFGQWLSGMARLSAATGDTDLRDKAILLADEWTKTIGPDGNPRLETYSWEKMACGLVDLAIYAGYEQAIPTLSLITSWANERFDRSRSAATPQDRDGRKPHGTLEWYTLSENMYRAYQATGKTQFLDFGKLWEYPTYWNRFADTNMPAEGVNYLHSYSHVNTFCGAAMAYAVTGDEHYLKIVRNAYDWITRTQAYASGGYGPGEWSVPADGTLGRALEMRSDSAEIPCGSWAAFKLSRYLTSFTGEARYSDWMETMLYNGIGAALPVQADGRTFYYADYRLGTATKLFHWDEWPCCSGTYIQCMADYHNLIYYKNASGLFVNLFVPSEVTWRHDNHDLTLRQTTAFPENDESTLRVTCATPVTFALNIRVPSWANGMTLAVNGKPENVHVVPGQWAAIEREWRSGDTVTIKTGAKLYLTPVDPQHPKRAAIKYGPVMLAQQALFSYPLALQEEGSLSKRFARQGPGLHFKVSDLSPHEQHTGSFMPFYEIPERLPYRVYFDLEEPRFL